MWGFAFGSATPSTPLMMKGCRHIFLPVCLPIKSNFATAKLILGGHSDPEIFHVTTTQKTAAGLAIYANSITLTPGTVTMDIDESASKDQFLVHALHADFADDVRSKAMDWRVTALEMNTDPKPKGKVL